MADETYLRAFRGWESIDVFVYFAHNRVSMPPPQWVAACHERGVPCLATLITEQAPHASRPEPRLASPCHALSPLFSSHALSQHSSLLTP